MKLRHFLSKVEHARLHAAIQTAEAGNSGDVVLFITHEKVEHALAAAHREFHRLKLDQAPAQNSFLIYVAPDSQKFAVVGGKALHHKVGQHGWDHLSALLQRYFRDGNFTEGLVNVIAQVGEKLKEHFPARDVDRAGQKDIVED